MSNEPLSLDVDLQNVDTSFPVLVAGNYDLRITSITREENSEKTGFNAVVVLETTESAKSTKDADVPRGYKLKQFLALQPKAGTTDPEGWKKRIAAFMDAAMGTTQGTRSNKFNSEELVNKIVRAAVVVGVNEKTGNQQNDIKSLSYPT